MADIYTISVTGVSPGAAPGEVMLTLERTSGTECEEIYAQYENMLPWLAEGENWMRLTTPLSGNMAHLYPICICVSPNAPTGSCVTCPGDDPENVKHSPKHIIVLESPRFKMSIWLLDVSESPVSVDGYAGGIGPSVEVPGEWPPVELDDEDCTYFGRTSFSWFLSLEDEIRSFSGNVNVSRTISGSVSQGSVRMTMNINVFGPVIYDNGSPPCGVFSSYINASYTWLLIKNDLREWCDGLVETGIPVEAILGSGWPAGTNGCEPAYYTISETPTVSISALA